MRRMLCVVSALMMLSFASFAGAQFGKGGGPSFRTDFNPVVGAWSEYQIKTGNEPPGKMKIAIVGKEGDAYWFESVMERQREGKMISKMLVSGNPEDQKNVKRMIVKMGNEAPMEMPVQMMGGRPGPGQEAGKGKVVEVGTETIKVPAGSFTTRHMQYQDSRGTADTWVAKDVYPYGAVKSQSADFEMVLTGYGTGATTLITETPKKFEMPQMPQMPKGFPKGALPGKEGE